MNKSIILREYKRFYRLANQDRMRQQEAEYRAANIEKIKKRDAERYNPEAAKAFRQRNQLRLREYQRAWYQRNKAKRAAYNARNKAKLLGWEAARRKRSSHLLYQKRYRMRHREKNRLYLKNWTTLNHEKIKEWKRKNQSRTNAYQRMRRRTDPSVKICMTLRCRMYYALRHAGAIKSESAIALLGCTVPFLKHHLSQQFKRGMTWENHGAGKDKWHIDHIIPCSSFDFTQLEHQRMCFHYSNLQPLWSTENQSKGNRVLQ